MEKDIVIDAKCIKKSYKKPVINDASFTAKKGDIICIIGRNGCGKSTLLSILAGALKPDSGSLYYCGEDAFSQRGVFKSKTGYVPQENPIIEQLSVKDNIMFWNSRNMKKAIDVAKMLGLSEVINIKAGKLSGGMKKRLSIACAIAPSPPILILDELAASLDIISVSDIKRYIREYSQNGGTVILSSHQQEEIDVCTRLIAMNDGVLKEISPSLRGADLEKEIL